MTTLPSPHYAALFDRIDLARPEILSNRAYLDSLETSARAEPVFDHPFLRRLADGRYGEEAVRFSFIQFSKHIRVFTSCLSHLLGMAPDIRDRILLFENLNEEMGRGRLSETHYMLYLRLLASIGVSIEEIERTPTLTSIELLNDGLTHAIQRSFQAGLAWLGIGGELIISNNFPYLSRGIVRVFPHADLAFFERHGAPDQAHNDDSNLLLALRIEDDAGRERVRAEARKSLFLRAAVWTEIGEAADRLSSSGA